MHAKRGFTLIEILVVVIIIGITIGFALLAFGDFGASRRAVLAAEQLSSYIKLVQEQAIVEGTTLGIDVTSTGYSTYRLEQNKWQSMTGSNVFHIYHFPDNVTAYPRLNVKTANKKNPDIIINATGEVSSFSIDFGSSKNTVITTLSNLRNGQLILQPPKN